MDAPMPKTSNPKAKRMAGQTRIRAGCALNILQSARRNGDESNDAVWTENSNDLKTLSFCDPLVAGLVQLGRALTFPFTPCDFRTPRKTNGNAKHSRRLSGTNSLVHWRCSRSASRGQSVARDYPRCDPMELDPGAYSAVLGPVHAAQRVG